MIKSDQVGVVVIGRNEGERLKASLRSLEGVGLRVYVDSGSTDGSQAAAVARGFELVELAVPPGFTAARARNAGVARLLELGANPQYIQMVDGDCEIAPGWIDAAVVALDAEPKLAAVFGRRRERFPDASVYNMLCDDEWDVPIGIVNACGGDALFRLQALQAAGGYAPDLIAGEEPDLCLRLRAMGWRIRRIDAEMTLHDAAMTRFGQWWKRSRRAGHAFAELAFRHGAKGDPAWRRQTASIVGWGGMGLLGLLGLVIGLLSEYSPVRTAAAVVIGLWALQTARLVWKRRDEGAERAIPIGLFLMLGKFPQLQGVLDFHRRRLMGAETRLIEYKGEAAGG
jgi:GT2 family glycosyltransferase